MGSGGSKFQLAKTKKLKAKQDQWQEGETSLGGLKNQAQDSRKSKEKN